MSDDDTGDADVLDLIETGEVQTSALAPAPQQDPAAGGSYVRNVDTGEVTKIEPVR